MKNEKINGWIDDTETVSPIDDLFSLLVPMLMMEGTPSPPPLQHLRGCDNALTGRFLL